jgi:FtsH-binding integral membrane protein
MEDSERKKSMGIVRCSTFAAVGLCVVLIVSFFTGDSAAMRIVLSLLGSVVALFGIGSLHVFIGRQDGKQLKGEICGFADVGGSRRFGGSGQHRL